MGRLPDFVILGTAKAGTTALQENLSRHPEIHVGPKTPHPIHGPEWHHYFRDEALDHGPDWYADLFDTDKKILGDKATVYLGYVECHARIATLLPDAKFLVCLREPVARAYSHWNHFCQLHVARSDTWHSTSFEKIMGLGQQSGAMSQEPDGCFPLTADSRRLNALPPWYHRELQWYGHYADHLEHLFRFVDRSRVSILIAERVLADMPGQYARVFEFLGAPPNAVPASAYRTSNAWPYGEPADPATAARLQEYYRPHNARLFELLGTEIPEWNAGV